MLRQFVPTTSPKTGHPQAQRADTTNAGGVSHRIPNSKIPKA
ncbi:hypothetical protein RRSWK_01330 [Rhodopirellula sp. SWK7]|nr:hypothetical protein RRSWK_01330 [Rhodopirellula sp. SWK7]